MLRGISHLQRLTCMRLGFVRGQRQKQALRWARLGLISRKGRAWRASYLYPEHTPSFRLSPHRLAGLRIVSYRELEGLYRLYGPALNGIFLQTSQGLRSAGFCLRAHLGGHILYLD